MTRQAIPNSVDFYVDVAADLTTSVDDLRLADGARSWVRAAGGDHGLWCLDQTSALPIGPGVVPTLSGAGRWIYFGSGFVPPPPPGAGSPYEFVFQPGGVATGNVYTSWPLLVAAAAAFPGTKLVHFDDQFAPCVIPPGAWNLGPGSTVFTASGGPLSGLASPTVTISDGATLQGVYQFQWIDVDSQSTSFVIDAPAGQQTIYGFDYTARVRQTGVGGLFIRAAGPGTIALVGMRGASSLVNAGGRVLGATAAGAVLGVGTLEASNVGSDTIESVVGSTVIPLLVEPASTLDPTQPGVLSGPFVPALGSAAAKVSYNDGLVPPPLGANDVQAAIDALKGGGLPGFPNSILFENPLGTGATTDASLVAAPVDPFGRPQVWDYRVGGAGAVYRNGSWTQDGDPTDVTGDGFVSYGPSAAGLGPNGTDGGYARVKPNRFGLAQVVGGGPLTYYWRVDQTQMVYRDDLGVDKFSVDRATGNTFVAENGRLFMGNNGVLHGSSARIQLSSTIANAAQFRGYQYGANAAGAGITTFKSRSLVITPGAPPWPGSGVLAGDLLGRWTAIGVAPDDTSIPLAALVSLQVPASFVPAAQNYAPSEYELQLVPLAGPVNGARVVFKVSSEGEAQSFFKLAGPGGLTTQAGFATYALLGDAFPTSKITSNAAGGVVQMGAGGASAPDVSIQRVPPSGGVPQVVVDDNASGAVNVIPAADQISKLGTRSAADGGVDPVSMRWAEVNAVAVNTGDLNLIDQEKDAHWTIIEERDRILVVNRKTGRRYAMAMVPVDDE